MIVRAAIIAAAGVSCAPPPTIPADVWQPLIGAGVVLINALAGYLIYLAHRNGGESGGK